MKIIIESIPHQRHRYETLGDYYIDSDGVRRVFISKLGDERMELLIAIHELVEWFATEHDGIHESEILQFDIEHPDLNDPGSDPRAPYHERHIQAEGVERLVAALLGVQWADYTKACEAL